MFLKIFSRIMEINKSRVKNNFNIKRVFFLTQYFPPDYASTGQIMRDLIYKLENKSTIVYTGFPSYARNKYSNTNSFEKYKNIKIYRTFLSNFWPKKIKGRIINSLLFTFNVFMKLLFNSNQNDLLVYTSEPPFLSGISWIINLFKKSPYILILFDIYPELITEISILKENNLIIKFWKFLNKITFSLSNEIVVLNKEMKEKILLNYELDHRKISVISTWVDEKKLEFISREDNWFLEKFNLKNKFVVMYSGNQGRGHDFNTILEAANLLKGEKDIVFVFIGNGFQNKFLRDVVKTRLITNCIFLPFQKLEDLSYSLSSADLGLVSIKEGMEGLIAPSKLYGYLAVSVPVIVISPEKSYIKNIVEETNCGMWFSNNESNRLANWILEMKSDKVNLKTLGSNGRDFILKNANTDLCIGKYKELLRTYNVF